MTILTEKFGKVKAIAKGVRKIKSRLAGSLEPFMLLDLQLHEGKTFFIVTGAVIEKEFPKIHSDLKKTSKAFFVGELIDKFLQEHQKSSEAFFLFQKALLNIEENNDAIWMLVFELKLVESAGFHPELFECVHCRKKLVPENNFWDSVEGGVICADCQGQYHHGQKVTDELIKFLRFVQENSFDQAGKLMMKDALKNEAEKVLSEYIKSVLERDLKSERFMRDTR